MIDILSAEFTRGELPELPFAHDVALEAGVPEFEAYAMISAAWAQAEAFTGRTYYPVTAGEVVAHVRGFEVYRWPRYPYPASLNVEVRMRDGWQAHSETYLSGMIELEGPLTYRLTQPDPITPPEPPEHVQQAVFNLATYQLIQSPARREFNSQNAGDTGFSRERFMGLFWASGAGPLLASEVRKP